jgi:hypothetical protein
MVLLIDIAVVMSSASEIVYTITDRFRAEALQVLKPIAR